MMKYTTLKALLEKLEQKWFKQLQDIVPSIPLKLQPITNGYAQFFSLEHLTSGAAPDTATSLSNAKLPVIVAVGINYSQGPCSRSPATLEHWLNSRPPSPGTNWVVDPSPPTSIPSSTRRILDLNLAQYFLNEAQWKNNCIASDTGLLPQFKGVSQGQPYILVFANLSPFLTRYCWTDTRIKSVQAQLLLNAWNPNNHLCDLMRSLSGKVDLWVVHGKGEVWPRFQTCCGSISNWLLTENLSGRNIPQIKSFWKSSSCGVTARKHPIWPCCPRIHALGKSTAFSMENQE